MLFFWAQTPGGRPLARSNYKFKKRQKELKKQKKREEKLLRKHGRRSLAGDAETQDSEVPEDDQAGDTGDDPED